MIPAMFIDNRIFEERAIARSGRYKITMDGIMGPEKEPHVHVFDGGDGLASVSVASGEVLDGEIPRDFRKRFLKWLFNRQKMLLEDWQMMQEHKYPRDYGEIGI